MKTVRAERKRYNKTEEIKLKKTNAYSIENILMKKDKSKGNSHVTAIVNNYY